MVLKVCVWLFRDGHPQNDLVRGRLNSWIHFSSDKNIEVVQWRRGLQLPSQVIAHLELTFIGRLGSRFLKPNNIKICRWREQRRLGEMFHAKADVGIAILVLADIHIARSRRVDFGGSEMVGLAPAETRKKEYAEADEYQGGGFRCPHVRLLGYFTIECLS